MKKGGYTHIPRPAITRTEQLGSERVQNTVGDMAGNAVKAAPGEQDVLSLGCRRAENKDSCEKRRYS